MCIGAYYKQVLCKMVSLWLAVILLKLGSTHLSTITTFVHWLTVLPISLHHFDLSATEFRDSLTIRYHRPLIKAPANRDGCGEPYSCPRLQERWTCDPASQ